MLYTLNLQSDICLLFSMKLQEKKKTRTYFMEKLAIQRVFIKSGCGSWPIFNDDQLTLDSLDCSFFFPFKQQLVSFRFIHSVMLSNNRTSHIILTCYLSFNYYEVRHYQAQLSRMCRTFKLIIYSNAINLAFLISGLFVTTFWIIIKKYCRPH